MEITEVGAYLEMYEKLIKRLKDVKESYWTMSTYPHQPIKGEIPERDEYFEFYEKFVFEHHEIEFKRIVTVTHRSKYDWTSNLINKFSNHPKCDIGYVDIGENCLPFMGIMIFDKKEIFLTAITEPKSEALYFHSTNEQLCKFYTHYFDRSWEQFCMKLKEGTKLHRTNLEELNQSIQKPRMIKRDLKAMPSQEIKAAVVQLNLTDYLKYDGTGLLCIKEDMKENLKRKINQIFNFCSSERCDIVVLPELSTCGEFVESFKETVEKQDMIIVGGSFYDSDTRMNKCPITLQGNCYFTEKVHLSPNQMAPWRGHGAVSGNIINIFQNTTVGSFAVVICMDYLERAVMDEIYSMGDVDFLIVTSLNNNSERFFSRMPWDCEQSAKGVYILYSNSILIDKDEEDKNITIGDGRTSIWGIMDKRYVRHAKTDFLYQLETINSDEEGIVMAYFNRTNKKPNIEPIPKPPNVRDIEIYKIMEKDCEEIKFIKK